MSRRSAVPELGNATNGYQGCVTQVARTHDALGRRLVVATGPAVKRSYEEEDEDEKTLYLYYIFATAAIQNNMGGKYSRVLENHIKRWKKYAEKNLKSFHADEEELIWVAKTRYIQSKTMTILEEMAMFVQSQKSALRDDTDDSGFEGSFLINND